MLEDCGRLHCGGRVVRAHSALLYFQGSASTSCRWPAPTTANSTASDGQFSTLSVWPRRRAGGPCRLLSTPLYRTCGSSSLSPSLLQVYGLDAVQVVRVEVSRPTAHWNRKVGEHYIDKATVLIQTLPVTTYGGQVALPCKADYDAR
jgi:hypothetical protein